MSSEAVALSKKLSWLLRHGAGEAGLAMDRAGWAEVLDVLAVLGMTRAQLDLAVANNDKGRLVLEGSRVRACQGHSLADMPVTVEDLEASWETVSPEASLWHGTGRTQSMASPGTASCPGCGLMCTWPRAPTAAPGSDPPSTSWSRSRRRRSRSLEPACSVRPMG